jgi:steroid 5-alpha reductase family enzyme
LLDDALRFAMIACGVLAAIVWLLSLVTREYSWVDRLWSLAPPAYAWWFACASGFHPRAIAAAALASVWGVRLTFNFARKGGYAKGGEDYRWKALRERMHPALFAAFNVVFVSAFQNAILLAITLPSWAGTRPGCAPLGWIDAAAIALFVAFLAMESIADEQQWRFQRDKAAKKARGEPIEREFVTTGLFQWSRHPNFFSEQAMWWSFYLFALAGGGGAFHWTIAGAAVLTCLFQGSTTFTEKLTLAKYPSYAKYQRTTSRLLPLPPRGDPRG